MNALFSFLVSLNLHKLVDAWAFAIRFNAIARAVAPFGFICSVGLILTIGGKILLEIYKADNR